VTRARAQAATLIDELERLGATVIALPVIEIIDPPDFSAVDEAISHLATYDWVVLTSTNGVDRFFARLARQGDPVALLEDVRIAAVGTATAARVAGKGVSPELVPDDFHAEGLAAALLASGVREGWRVLLPRALKGRDVLPQELSAAGAAVDVVPVYQTVPSPIDPEMADLLRDGVDAITFTSPSTVKHFVAFLEAAALDSAHLLENSAIVSIGPVTSKALRARGMRVDVEPEVFTAHSMAQAVARHFGE
jgi:uroporphyrinogen III methyltransferase/synthase